MAKSKKERAALRAQKSCTNVLGDDKICDKVYDKAMTVEKKKKGD